MLLDCGKIFLRICPTFVNNVLNSMGFVTLMVVVWQIVCILMWMNYLGEGCPRANFETGVTCWNVWRIYCCLQILIVFAGPWDQVINYLQSRCMNGWKTPLLAMIIDGFRELSSISKSNFVCQMSQDAVLIRDVMKHRNWTGNPKCSFVMNLKPLNIFSLLVHMLGWSGDLLVLSLGTDFCPNNIWQYHTSCYAFLPGQQKIYIVGLVVVCWAIWNCINIATFEFKLPN